MKYILLISLFFLTSCASTEPAPTAQEWATLTPAPAPVTPTIENCAYMEATQSLPELTAQVDQAIKQLQGDATGRAEAYGENCVYQSSGQSTFSAMETDFYFTINVKRLDNDKELGTWIISTMKIIEAFPTTSLSGPQAGYVEFTFQTADHQKILRVQINQYKSLPSDISPSDLITTLFPNP